VENDKTYHIWGFKVLWKQNLENDVKRFKKNIAKVEKIFGLCCMWGELILILIGAFFLLENGP